MDNAQALVDLKTIKQVFDKFEVPFFLAYGTALGAYRDGEFLPGDDDIDLGVIEPISGATRMKIGRMLFDLGFIQQQILFNIDGTMLPPAPGYNGTEETGIIVCERNVKITLFFFKEEECETHGTEKVCVPMVGAFKLISSPAKFYKKLNKIKFKKMEFLIPAPTEDYLAFTYNDWKNPNDREHGKCYHEMHPEYMTHMTDVLDKNEAIIINK